MSWTFFLATFGCKVNQYESQSLREAWTALGGTETEDASGADYIVLNTCSVTAQATSDARHAVRRLHRLAPDAAIVITGCSATSSGDELAALPGVMAVIAQADKESLLQGPHVHAAAGSDAARLDVRKSADYPVFSIASFRRARPVLKVQDGCTHRCTYCIVPLMRGPSRSRPFGEVLAEARRLLDSGYREIMLSGINLHQFELDDGGDFWDLVSRLDTALAPAWKGRARLRLSSLDPAQLGPRKGTKPFDVLAGASLVCPHLHLSLQSGSPETLRLMGRGHYSPKQVMDAVGTVRSIWPLFGLGADILMGFPGETGGGCEETLELLHALPLTYGHVFPFSPRPGTPAAAMPDLPGPIKQERAKRARDIIREKQRAFCATLASLPELAVVLDAPNEADPESGPSAESPSGESQSGEGHSAGAYRYKGVCEYYAACLVEPGAPNALASDNRSILRVKPRLCHGERIITSLQH